MRHRRERLLSSVRANKTLCEREAELMIVRGKAADDSELFEFTIEPFVSGGFRLDIRYSGDCHHNTTGAGN